MLENESAIDLVRRVRECDAAAAEELVRRYEPAIRRRVRVWLRLQDPRLRRVFDSMDVCQSVLASFFLRASSGQYDLEEPGQLLRLLVTIARNKVASVARGQYRRRRDGRRLAAGGDEALRAVASPEPGPSEVVAGAELIRAFRERLAPDERALAELRAEGLAWAEVAERLGGTPHGRRMQLSRAVDRVAKQLGLGGEGLADG